MEHDVVGLGPRPRNVVGLVQPHAPQRRLDRLKGELESGGDALLLGALMGAFFVAVLFAGEAVMRLLYPGGAYEGHGMTLAVLTLGTLIASLAIPASNALASMERSTRIQAKLIDDQGRVYEPESIEQEPNAERPGATPLGVPATVNGRIDALRENQMQLVAITNWGDFDYAILASEIVKAQNNR